MTISAGIATYPSDADSATGLLAAVAQVLGEAKAGGGDAIRVCGREADAGEDTRTFNVLQGLVFAIDTKDRYTKRHSEDVARYAVFLAGQVGLEPALIEAIRTARAAPRRGQDRDPRHDPAQARSPYRRGVRGRQAARRPRRLDRPRPRRDRDRAHRHPPPPRALGRQGLPRRPRRRGDPARRPDPGRGRCLLGDDDDPAVSQGALRGGGAAPPRRRGGEPARRATRGRVHRGHRARRGCAAPRLRSRGSRCGCRRTASPDRGP